MDLQIVLIFILVLLTVNFLVIGVYVAIVLREFRQTLKKSNKVLEDVQSVTDNVASPITSIVSVVTGVVEGFKAVKGITSLMDVHEHSHEKKEDK